MRRLGYLSEVQTVRELFLAAKYAHRGKDIIPKFAAVIEEVVLCNHT